MIDKLLNKYSLISDQVKKSEIKIILECVSEVLEQNIAGDIVEMGCYKGTTSLFIARLLKELKSNKKLYLYDSFMGLPARTSQDGDIIGAEFKAGELRASKRELIRNFKHANLVLPVIKKAWFSELTAKDLPKTISLAYFDGDFYESIKDSFAVCIDKFSSGSIIVVDDYTNTHLIGARQAVDEWVKSNHSNIESVKVAESLAIIKLV